MTFITWRPLLTRAFLEQMIICLIFSNKHVQCILLIVDDKLMIKKRNR